MNINEYISPDNNPYSGSSESLIDPFAGYTGIVGYPDASEVDSLPDSYIDIPQQIIAPDASVIYDSDGNEIPIGWSYSPAFTYEGVSSLSDDIMELASVINSTQGYFNTSVLDVLDRVVSGSSQDYYIAYRYDADAYNAYMYLAEKYDVSGDRYTLYDSVFVQVYRYRYNTSSQYNYYYLVSDVGTVELDIGSNALCYTNMKSDYPTLGNKAQQGVYKGIDYIFIELGVILGLMIFRVFRRG